MTEPTMDLTSYPKVDGIDYGKIQKESTENLKPMDSTSIKEADDPNHVLKQEKFDNRDARFSDNDFQLDMTPGARPL